MRAVLPRPLVAVLIGLTVSTGLTAMVSSAGSAASAAGQEDAGQAGRFDRPFVAFAPPSTVLRDGRPADVGLAAEPIESALARIDAWTEPSGTTRPMFAGAVTVLVHDGVVVTRDATGDAVRYTDGAGSQLPPAQRVPMRPDTIFDLASVSKLFTSIVALQQVERGLVELDAPVARYVPEYAANGKEAVTVQQLLTHTSGMRSWLPLWRDHPDRASRIMATLTDPLQAPPGTRYTYSDLNLITLGVLVERVTGSTLDALVRDGITAPLGLADTGYNPDPSKLDRIAATEYQAAPPRGIVRGQVHDENAWSLGGVAGHAGVFSTAADLAVLGQTILNGGSYRGARILRQDTVTAMLTNYNTGFPANSHGLGFELDQRFYMDALSGARTAGHTGFTGTSLVVDPASRSVVILLTNRVHPSRSWGSNNPARRAVATALSTAMSVPPRHGESAWYSGIGDGRTATLDVDLAPRRAGRLAVEFDLFVDTEATDVLVLESEIDTVDGGATWQRVPFSASGESAPGDTDGSVSGAGHRAWWRASAVLPGDPDEPVRLRWRYTSDPLYTGRGVYVDGVLVRDARGVLLDGERHPEAFSADGWRPSSR